MSVSILDAPIRDLTDVVNARQCARRLAETLGFDAQDQTRIATAVSEIARSALALSSASAAEFLVEEGTGGREFLVRISHCGPDVDALRGAFDGTAPDSPASAGMVGARRLMDRSEILFDGDGRAVLQLAKRLPARSGRLDTAALRGLSQDRPADPAAEIESLNRELMASLAELRDRQEELDQLNRELEDTNRGVVALYAELEEKAEQLRQASELKSRFLSNMSHEFRTPLNSVLALSRLLLDKWDGPLTAEQEKQVGFIRSSAESLLELVNDLLDLAKVEAGKLDVRPSEFTVDELFGGLRGALRPLQTSEAVALVIEDAAGLPSLHTDQGKIGQILRNFISNALKFTEKGEVRVRAAWDPGRGLVTFTVADTGIGIAPEHRELIFEEFAQVDHGLQRKHKGTGLGLPLSRKLAELLGGEVAVESAPGRGSVFTLVVPRLAPGVAAPEQVPAADAQARSDRRRVLVIDDEEAFRYVFRQIIATDVRFELHEATNGAEGLQRAREIEPDLIVLDLQMPVLDGIGVLRALAADAALSAIPVVICTSSVITPELGELIAQAKGLVLKNALTREALLGEIGRVLALDGRT